jgi:hypothetical protein
MDHRKASKYEEKTGQRENSIILQVSRLNFVYIFHIPMRATCSALYFLDFITLVILCNEYKL